MRSSIKFVFYLLLIISSCCHAKSQSNDLQPKNTTNASPVAIEEANNSREYHLKAAFLRYVAKYVEWPPNTIKNGIVNICVLGQVPSFEGLNSINGKVINELTLNIKKILSPNDAQECQVVFVTATENDNIPTIVSNFQKKPILSFGDMPGFAEKGGGMNFYIANNRLAIMVNLPPITEANLKVSPQMLRLVTIVP